MQDSGLDVAIAIFNRRKWIGLKVLAAALSLALPFVRYLPDVYRGEATVIIENQDVSAAFVRGTVPELETRLITIQQELLSRSRLTDLIARLNLYRTLRQHNSMEALVQRLRRDIRVDLSRADRSRPTTIGVKISYIGLDARSAAAVPNALAKMYIDENSKVRERQTSQMAEFLKGQVEAARVSVDMQQARVNRFKEGKVGELPEQISINMVSLERLNERLRINLDEQMNLRRRLDRFTAASAPEEDPLEKLQQELTELQAKYTDKHPDVIRKKAEIAELQRSGAKPKKAPKPAADAVNDPDLEQLRREERTLRAEISTYEQRIQSAPKVEEQLEAIERDYNVARESYASILKRYEEAQLADSLEQTKNAESFRILDAAVVPAFPAAPNRLRLLITAVLFAFASAAGAMLLVERVDTSFHSVGELRQFTTVPVLASIPFVRSRFTFLRALRVVVSIAVVIGACVLFAAVAYHEARGNTQLVWMVSAPQL